MCIITAAALTAAGVSAAIAPTLAVAGNVAIVGALGASVAGTATSVIGQQQQAKAAKAQGKYEAQVARYEANLEGQKGVVENVRFGINARREWGKFMLANAASSRDLSFGNAAQQAIEMRQFHTFDADIIRRNTESRVMSLNLSADNAVTRARNLSAGYKLGAAGAGIAGFGSTLSQGVGYIGLGAGTLNALRFSDAVE